MLRFFSFIVFSVTLIILGCKNETTSASYFPEDDQVSKTDTNTAQIPSEEVISFLISIFEEAPTEIEGCGCYYTKALEDNLFEQFILVDDWGQTAYMIINGKQETFKLIDLQKPTDVRAISLYKNEDYNFLTNLNLEGTDEDGMEMLSGVLTVSDNHGNSEKFDIRGYCGC